MYPIGLIVKPALMRNKLKTQPYMGRCCNNGKKQQKKCNFLWFYVANNCNDRQAQNLHPKLYGFLKKTVLPMAMFKYLKHKKFDQMNKS